MFFLLSFTWGWGWGVSLAESVFDIQKLSSFLPSWIIEIHHLFFAPPKIPHHYHHPPNHTRSRFLPASLRRIWSVKKLWKRKHCWSVSNWREGLDLPVLLHLSVVGCERSFAVCVALYPAGGSSDSLRVSIIDLCDTQVNIFETFAKWLCFWWPYSPK